MCGLRLLTAVLYATAGGVNTAGNVAAVIHKNEFNKLTRMYPLPSGWFRPYGTP